MKNLKIVSIFVLLVLMVTVGTAFKGVVKNSSKHNFCLTNSYAWANSNLFEIGTAPTSAINAYWNWNQGTNITGGFLYLSQVDVSYSGMAPSQQQVLDAVRAEYDLLRSFGSGILSCVFTDGYSWSTFIGGTLTMITIYLQ